MHCSLILNWPKEKLLNWLKNNLRTFTSTTYTLGYEDPVPILQEVGWASGPVWIGAENLAPTGIRSPDVPARSESFYRVSYSTNIRTEYFKHAA